VSTSIAPQYLTSEYLSSVDQATLPAAAVPAKRGDAPADAAPPKRPFRLLSLDELEAIPPPTFLIDDLLPASALAAVYGPAKLGKTFVVLDMALSVASGRPFFGHQVRKGTVVYVIGEGRTGMGQRWRAWKAAHGVSYGVRFHVLPRAVQLLEPRHMVEFRKELDLLDEAPALVVFDTLARCFVGGEENSARDMGLAVNALDALKEQTGATVLVVHHTNRAGEEERGSGSLRGAVDTMMALKEENDSLTLTCVAQKDAAQFAPISIRLVKSEQSLAVAPPRPGTPQSAGKRARFWLEILSRDFLGGPASQNEWKEAGGKSDATFYRARGDLLRLKYVAQSEKGNSTRFSVTPDGRAFLTDLENSHSDSHSDNSTEVTSARPLSLTVGERGGAGDNAAGSQLREADSQAAFSFSRDSHISGNENERDLHAEIDERLGMQSEHRR